MAEGKVNRLLDNDEFHDVLTVEFDVIPRCVLVAGSVVIDATFRQSGLDCLDGYIDLVDDLRLRKDGEDLGSWWEATFARVGNFKAEW